MSRSDFTLRFGKLWPDLYPAKAARNESFDKNWSTEILRRMMTSDGKVVPRESSKTRELGYELGHTRVYFSSGILERLEVCCVAAYCPPE